MLEYHTFLHHSQTSATVTQHPLGLSTIHFYIILKHTTEDYVQHISLSTIHFYIILKRVKLGLSATIRLSTIHFYIILKRMRYIRP